MKPVPDSLKTHEGMIISQWKPTAGDRWRILFGKPIRVSVVGQVQPVLALDTKNLIAK